MAPHLGSLPSSGDYNPSYIGLPGPPIVGAHCPTGSGQNALPFTGDHYTPSQELSGPPLPFSGDHYSPGRSLNNQQYTGDRYERESPPIYPYMIQGSDGYRSRYEDSDARAPHPPNPRVHPRWRLSSPERGQPSPGRLPVENPNVSVRKWEMNRRASLQSPNPTDQWSSTPLARENVRAPSRGRSITRSPNHGRPRSPLYSPRASPVSFRGRPPRSPSPIHSPVYSPRASLSPIRGREQTPVRRREVTPIRRREVTPTRSLSRSPVRGRSRSLVSLRGRSPSPIRGRARSPLSPRSYVARLGRSRSRPPETYRPGTSRTRSPSVPGYRRRLSSYSRSRSRSSSPGSYRRRRTSSRHLRRSRSGRSVSGTRGRARSRSRDRSRSRASTLYSPTTTRLYSPVLSRRRLSRGGRKGRSLERGKKRSKGSNTAFKASRLPSPPEDDLYIKPKEKRSRSAESTGSIYGPEIPPELRTTKPARQSRDSSLSSYKSDNDAAKQQSQTTIPGLSEVEQNVPAAPSKTTQIPISPPLATQDTSEQAQTSSSFISTQSLYVLRHMPLIVS